MQARFSRCITGEIVQLRVAFLPVRVQPAGQTSARSRHPVAAHTSRPGTVLPEFLPDRITPIVFGVHIRGCNPSDQSTQLPLHRNRFDRNPVIVESDFHRCVLSDRCCLSDRLRDSYCETISPPGDSGDHKKAPKRYIQSIYLWVYQAQHPLRTAIITCHAAHAAPTLDTAKARCCKSPV